MLSRLVWFVKNWHYVTTSLLLFIYSHSLSQFSSSVIHSTWLIDKVQWTNQCYYNQFYKKYLSQVFIFFYNDIFDIFVQSLKKSFVQMDEQLNIGTYQNLQMTLFYRVENILRISRCIFRDPCTAWWTKLRFVNFPLWSNISFHK